ncbi:PaaI family thioesterase [Streptomyces sp. NBC_00510]
MTETTGPALDPEAAGAFLRAVGLRFDAISAQEVTAHLEVTEDHHTPWGITHGGLHTTVIESVASVGASHAVRSEGRFAVGVSNQTDFLLPYVKGRLDVRGTPLQQGRSLQLWLVVITDAEGRTIARGQVRLFNRSLPAQ